MFIKTPTYIAKWTGVLSDPVWHGELTVRAASGTHQNALQKLVDKGEAKAGIYIVSTPLPTANTPRVISHLFLVDENKFVGILNPKEIMENKRSPKITTWPPK